MSAATRATRAPEVAPLGRMLWMETRAKLVSRLRNPAFTVLSLGLPVMFFLLFNSIFGRQAGAAPGSVARLILVSYATYGVGNVMIYNFGIGLATDRGRKLDLLQRATPLPPFVATIAYVVFALVFALLSLVILGLVATIVGGVRLELTSWLDLAWRLMLGSFPFIAMGMAIGYGASPNAAPAFANMIYLPMLFLSGIFVPLNQLPTTIQHIGSVLPTYHYAELSWTVIGVNNESTVTALAWLAGWSFVLFALTIRLYRLDQDKKFS
ncbi:MAG TPA: ABC transporter permease [Candidatus Dormibacteraeota bacterium]|jgi:ABC-2 type transport system permease protein